MISSITCSTSVSQITTRATKEGKILQIACIKGRKTTCHKCGGFHKHFSLLLKHGHCISKHLSYASFQNDLLQSVIKDSVCIHDCTDSCQSPTKHYFIQSVANPPKLVLIHPGCITPPFHQVSLQVCYWIGSLWE